MARTSYFNLQFPLQADSGCILQPIYPEWHAEKALRLNLHPAAQHHSFVLAHLRPRRQQTFSLEAERQRGTEIYSASQVRLLGEHRCSEGFVLHLCLCVCVCVCVFQCNSLPTFPSFSLCVCLFVSAFEDVFFSNYLPTLCTRVCISASQVCVCMCV